MMQERKADVLPRVGHEALERRPTCPIRRGAFGLCMGSNQTSSHFYRATGGASFLLALDAEQASHSGSRGTSCTCVQSLACNAHQACDPHLALPASAQVACNAHVSLPCHAHRSLSCDVARSPVTAKRRTPRTQRTSGMQRIAVATRHATHSPQTTTHTCHCRTGCNWHATHI